MWVCNTHRKGALSPVPGLPGVHKDATQLRIFFDFYRSLPEYLDALARQLVQDERHFESRKVLAALVFEFEQFERDRCVEPGFDCLYEPVRTLQP